MTKAGNSQITRTITLLITIFSLSIPAYAQYGGGTGEPNDPYQIAKAEDMMLLGDSPEDYDKHFILTADIDMDPNLPGRKVFDKAVIGFSWVPPSLYPFTGVFDGNNLTVSHLTINGVGYLGLFGQLESGAEIRDLGVVDVEIYGAHGPFGGLVGDSHGSITNCYVTGLVNGYWRPVGGLVGSNNGSITSCCSTATVTGDENVGGLVGENSGSIATSYSTGTVSGVASVGGLVGFNSLMGLNKSSIITSYSTGTVIGHYRFGGLVGQNFGTISSSFWDVQTSAQKGSFGGTGLTTAEMQDIDTFLYAGWDFTEEVLNGTCDYWQISPGDYPRLRYHSGDAPSMPEGLGTVDEPYQIRNTHDLGTMWREPMSHYRLDMSVDLSGITWSMAVIPWFEGTFDGNGLFISNLHIEGRRHLGLFAQLGSGAGIYNLGLNVVDVNGTGDHVGGLAGNSYGDIAECYSTGTVTGGFFVVGGLVGENGGNINNCHSTATVTGSWQVGGLVGSNSNDGNIRMSHGGSVIGVDDVGGLVGENKGSISVCYSADTVTGSWSVGGLVGSNSRDGNISKSYNTGRVNGFGGVGGLVGSNLDGNIATSYSRGSVSGYNSVGGLVGTNTRGSIVSSYSAGSVGGENRAGGLLGFNRPDTSIVSGFWDVETSGKPNSDGGTGLITAEMQMESTFLEAGWDFVDETENGTEDIWWILEGQDYPRLWWESLE